MLPCNPTPQLHTRFAERIPIPPAASPQHRAPLFAEFATGTPSRDSGDLLDRAAPHQIAEFENVSQVTAGDMHSLAISSDGEVYSFGWGAAGRLGLESAPFGAQTTPSRLEALAGVRIAQVSAGSTHSLAVGEEGELYAWGVAAYGRLGLGKDELEGAPVQSRLLPEQVRVGGGVNVWQASAGDTHSLIVATDGSLYSFGNGGYGRLGHGDEDNRWEPTLVRALRYTPVAYACAGMAHSLIHLDAGGVMTFGCGNYGVLGHTDTQNKLVPTAIPGLNNVVAVTTGAAHAVACLADGQLWSWGSNEFGQLGSERVSTGLEAGSAEPVAVKTP